MADIKDRAREYLAEHSEYSEVFGQTFVAVDTLTAMVEFAEHETKELEAEKDKAWWEGFDTCKAKAGEANIKLNDELEKLKKQLEELPDKWCRNKDDYCPHLAKLEKENAELKFFKQDCIRLTEDNVVMARQRAETARQLTKAKELLKWFVWYFREDYNNVPYKHKVGEAEQFLSEVDNALS